MGRLDIPPVGKGSSVPEVNGPPATNRDLYFGSDPTGAVTGHRWALEADNTAETGTNTGSDFRVNGHSDTGTFIKTYVFVKRATGFIGVGTNTPTQLFDLNGSSIRVRTAKTPATATSAGDAGQICWDTNYVYVCVATNTWKRSPLTTW